MTGFSERCSGTKPTLDGRQVKLFWYFGAPFPTDFETWVGGVVDGGDDDVLRVFGGNGVRFELEAATGRDGAGEAGGRRHVLAFFMRRHEAGTDALAAVALRVAAGEIEDFELAGLWNW